VVDLASIDHLVKICGVTTPEDAAMCVVSGANAVGVMVTASVRQVPIERVDEILAPVAGRALRVGVVRAGEFDVIERLVAEATLDALQLHEAMPSDLAAFLHGAGLAVIKAVAIADLELEETDDPRIDALHVDGPRPGSGEAHTWEPLIHRHLGGRVIAAGGLTATSVAGVIAETGVWGVDVSTAVESAPGRKDPARVVDFVRAARGAFAERSSR
jgi:phosphoribosylanthranilate isomerase